MSGTSPTYCCYLCSGRIIQSTVGSGVGKPAWVHVDEEDWVDRPHNAKPRGT